MSRDESTQQLAKDPLVGEMLGPYEVIARVAEGGMGVILAAQHTKIGRRVAIKLLRDDLVKNKDQVSRFLNEAKTVNRVGHPNIIQIYDFIEDWEREPPLVYMVMEYLVGRNLHEYVDAMSCLSADETIDIADEICAALVAMHDVNVLHLDLKPHNIFLASGDTSVREQRVKLLDFGVSRVFAEGQRVELTDPGQLIGTPKYMAPEQILGRPLDVRADIYALGLVMYKMLVGDLFIQAEEVGALLVEQVHTEPPSEIIAGDGRRVPPVLEKVVHRCLRKVAAERYGSARELRDALRLARASQTGKVAALPEGDATGEMTLRSGGAMRAAVVVLLVLLCGGGLWLWLRGGTGGNRRARAAGSGSASASGSATAAAMRADAAAGRTDSAAL
ncbi:MAG: serine/threonine protein kinase [Myxococcales bacterium]|nr:serine/threonine protein kinase [Myxococcales bacterium]